MNLIWDWAIRIVTGLTLTLGVVTMFALLAVLGTILAEWLAKLFRVYTILWEFIYFRHVKKGRESFLLEELALVRAELERVSPTPKDGRRD